MYRCLVSIECLLNGNVHCRCVMATHCGNILELYINAFHGKLGHAALRIRSKNNHDALHFFEKNMGIEVSFKIAYTAYNAEDFRVVKQKFVWFKSNFTSFFVIQVQK